MYIYLVLKCRFKYTVSTVCVIMASELGSSSNITVMVTTCEEGREGECGRQGSFPPCVM